MDPEDDTLAIEGEQQAQTEGEQRLEGEAAAGTEEGEGGAAEGEGAGEGESGDVVISLAGETVQPEEDENAAPQWVRELRKSNREKDRALRERDAEIARLKGSPNQSAAIVVGEEPKFEDCDYDPDKFKAAFKAWNDRKTAADAAERTRTQAQEQEQAKWKNRLTAVDSAAAKLGVKDHDDASATFEDVFSLVQRGIILSGPEDPKNSAALRYALGMNPKKAKELAGIADPIKFAIAIGKLEDKLSIAPRKTAPLPEGRVRGSAPISGAVDSVLERLQKEADKTGDRSKVAAHLRSKQQAARAA